MLGVTLILVLCLYIIFLYPIRKPIEVKEAEEKAERSEKYNTQMKKLWDVAQTSMKDRKPLRAEKALLTILKFDEKNAAAYNRLGILYAKEQNYDEAIECFEIAQSLDNNASSLHNVGLIYVETGAYEKAAMAFEQALELEDTVPATRPQLFALFSQSMKTLKMSRKSKKQPLVSNKRSLKTTLAVKQKHSLRNATPVVS